MLGLWADEVQIVVGQDFSEAGVFRQEAIAGMNRVGPCDFARCKQCGHVQIAVLGRRRSDADAFVSKPDMHGVCIRGRMHGNGRDAEFLAGAQHAQCNLAAIGNQDLVEHRSA